MLTLLAPIDEVSGHIALCASKSRGLRERIYAEHQLDAGAEY